MRKRTLGVLALLIVSFMLVTAAYGLVEDNWMWSNENVVVYVSHLPGGELHIRIMDAVNGTTPLAEFAIPLGKGRWG